MDVVAVNLSASDPVRKSMSNLSKRKDINRSAPVLACLNCRPKKVKCQLENGSCRRCLKLGLECFVPTEDERRLPCSKKVIRELQDRIKNLELELKAANGALVSQSKGDGSRKSSTSEGRWQPVESPPPMNADSPDSPLSLLARICSGQWQLSQSAGQLRFFGPTSSLHVTESVSSSILDNVDRSQPTSPWQAVLPHGLQEQLMELYWTYQHPVLQAVHKRAFLEGMETGRSQYYSELLLCCILACAARMSDNPDIRALALIGDDMGDDDMPYFVKVAKGLLDVELRRPSITTVQSMLLLSVIECAQCSDTKGWLLCGDACRLAFDLGLHRNCQYLPNIVLSPMELEVRQTTFWACFCFDVLWSLYLGRPRCIRLADVTIPHLPMNPPSGDFHIQMAAAWSRLLEIVGYISESLNGNDSESQISDLVNQLQDWQVDLAPPLRYQPSVHPAVHLLHMQYCAAQILLHRPQACFGIVSNPTSHPSALPARQICIANAVKTSQILADYEIHHGSRITMSGVALHAIATAATTLIASVVSKDHNVDIHFSCLKECIRALSQLEKSYYVTRRVRKIIQMIMRLLHLDATASSSSSSSTISAATLPAAPTIPPQMQINSIPHNSRRQPFNPDGNHVNHGNIHNSNNMLPMDPSHTFANLTADGADLQDYWEMPDSSPLRAGDFMFPASAQSTQFFLSSFEPNIGRM